MDIDQKDNKKEAALPSETVLVLQGGGSLGAYECGVYKSLYKHGIKFDILAGSSIGAINASIICSAQNANKDAAKVLENFWITLSEDIKFPVFLPLSTLLPIASSSFSSLSFDKMMAIISSMYSAIYGNPNAFLPRWFKPTSTDYYLPPYKWNYLYDSAPLKNTLKEFIDFEYLKETRNIRSDDDYKQQQSRLIITSTDVQKGEPVIFDSKKMDIDIDKIISCVGYPFYGITWSQDDNNKRYLWDGSLLTNTPMLDVIHASPQHDKEFYIVDVFPRQQKELPTNMIEVWHRARDIIFMDKTDKNIQMLENFERYLLLLKKVNTIINADDAQIDERTRARLKELEPEYYKLTQRRGAIVKELTRIGRLEKMHFLLEDADFSIYRIKKLIKEGEEDAERVLNKKGLFTKDRSK
jgi:NTE family protein